MSAPQVEILAIAVTAAVGCALVGTFLMLRRLAMLSDAISHAILPGIAVAFFITGDLGSPLMLVAAALTGVSFLDSLLGVEGSTLSGTTKANMIAASARRGGW